MNSVEAVSSEGQMGWRLLVLFAAVSVFASAWAAPGDQLTNESGALMQGALFIEIAAAAGGGVTVATVPNLGPGDRSVRIEMRQLDKNGRNMVVPPVLTYSQPLVGLGTAVNPYRSGVRLDVTVLGEVIAQWKERIDGGQTELFNSYVTSFGPNLSPLGHAFLLTQEPVLGVPASIARRVDGGFYVAWKDFGTQALYVRSFARNAIPEGPAVEVRAPVAKSVPNGTTITMSRPIVAIDATGDFQVGWLPSRDVGLLPSMKLTSNINQYLHLNAVEMQRYSPDQKRLGLPTQVDSSARVSATSHYEDRGDYLPDLSIVSDRRGGFIVTYIDKTIGIQLKHYDARNRAYGKTIEFQSSGVCPVTAVAEDGSFVVSWLSANRLNFRTFKADGTEVGTWRRIGYDHLYPTDAIIGCQRVSMEPNGRSFWLSWGLTNSVPRLQRFAGPNG